MPHRCLSVIVPCYNEEETIGRVLKTVVESPWVAEVIVVDDGSTDGSVAVLEGFESDLVRVLRQPKNRGKGAALRRGFHEAASEYVIVQDADLEYDPDEYGVMLEPLIDGRADVVFGSRFMSGRPHRVLYYRHSLGNRLLTIASNIFTDLNLTDMETCYKAFRRDVIQSLELEEDRFGIEPEVVAKVARGKYVVYEVGISYSGRTYAEGKKIGWRDAVRALYCVFKYSRGSSRGSWKARKAESPTLSDAGAMVDASLFEVLGELESAQNYKAWILDLAEPYLRGRILEIGAGRGTYSLDLLAHGQSLTAVEPSHESWLSLEARLRDEPHALAIEDGIEAIDGQKFETAVAFNVVEHIEDDNALLRRTAELIEPGGTFVIWVPAFPSLYGTFDREVGHHRRYRVRELERKLADAGFDVEVCRYQNLPGFVAWFVVIRLLGKRPTSGGLGRVYDRFVVPVTQRMERRVSVPFGQSIFAVGRRPASDHRTR